MIFGIFPRPAERRLRENEKWKLGQIDRRHLAVDAASNLGGIVAAFRCWKRFGK